MFSMFCKLFLFSAFTYVMSDNIEDVRCVKDGSTALVGKSDAELYDLTQQNLVIGQEMVGKRVEIANSKGFNCYKKFYDVYVDGLRRVLQNGEKERLDKSKTPEERSGAIKALAGITQGMRCDEDWRAKHVNETIESSECSFIERTGYPLMIVNFYKKLTLLMTTMKTAQLGLKLKNNVMSGIVGELSDIYHNVYTEGEKCASSLTTSADKCRNLKMFVKELDRLFYLLTLEVEAKIF